MHHLKAIISFFRRKNLVAAFQKKTRKTSSNKPILVLQPSQIRIETWRCPHGCKHHFALIQWARFKLAHYHLPWIDQSEVYPEQAEPSNLVHDGFPN